MLTIYCSGEVLGPDQRIALVPQVLAEFVHVVTDPRRFAQPLDMPEVLNKALFWWKAREVVHVYPTGESTLLFLEWMLMHQLGRKRLLDTQLASTLWAAGIRRVITSNAGDFAKFADIDVLSP